MRLYIGGRKTGGAWPKAQLSPQPWRDCAVIQRCPPRSQILPNDPLFYQWLAGPYERNALNRCQLDHQTAVRRIQKRHSRTPVSWAVRNPLRGPDLSDRTRCHQIQCQRCAHLYACLESSSRALPRSRVIVEDFYRRTCAALFRSRMTLRRGNWSINAWLPRRASSATFLTTAWIDSGQTRACDPATDE